MTKTTIQQGKKAVYVDGLTMKIGSKGKPEEASKVFAAIPTRGERRRLRKALNRAGYVDISMAKTGD